MPKINKMGGRNHKKMAGKYIRDNERESLRLSKSNDEIYGRIIKMNGGNADVMCSDKVTRLLQIRKKFRGRNKRDNNISLDVLVLVGLRSWEVRSEKKKPVVDLLYVYSPNQYDSLKDIPEIYEILPNEDSYKDESCGFIFSTKPTWMVKKEQDEAQKKLDEELKLKAEKEKEKEEAEKPAEINPHLNNETFAWNLDDDEEDKDGNVTFLDEFSIDDI